MWSSVQQTRDICMEESFGISISDIVYFIHIIVHIRFYKSKGVHFTKSFKTLYIEIKSKPLNEQNRQGFDIERSYFAQRY